VHVAECSIDTALGSDSVRSGGEELGDASSLEACLRESESGSETSTTGTDDDGIVLVINDGVVANVALTLEGLVAGL